MNKISSLLPVERFLHTLKIVQREGSHLSYSWKRLYAEDIDDAWVKRLEHEPELAERMEAFISRFGRMQDTIADKLLPRWLESLAEVPGSHIETLNRAERLGVINDVEQWLEARKLRNRLVHEYMEDMLKFAEDINLAKGYTIMLCETYNNIRHFAQQRMDLPCADIPVVNC